MYRYCSGDKNLNLLISTVEKLYLEIENDSDLDSDKAGEKVAEFILSLPTRF